MGFSLSWAAIRNATPHAVHEALGLKGTGAREEFASSEITGTTLPGGWYVIISQRDDLGFLKDAVIARLSRVGETVMCFIGENIACSFAACWLDGKRVWSIYHCGDPRVDHLEVKGEPPAPFASIRDRLRAQQAACTEKKPGVDYIFDIPVELAESLTGFQHDADIPGLATDAFEVLVVNKLTEKRISWWRKLLGK